MSLYLGTVKVTPTVKVTSAVVEALTVAPSTTSQTFNATSSVHGYAPVTVNAVTAAIDANIQPENIKKGVTILGVTGTLE